MDPTTSDVDAYLAGIANDTARATLANIRRTIKAIAPDALESVSYGMAAYKHKGQPLIYFAAMKNHCALYGVSVAEHADELAGYDTSSRGTLRFPHDQPPPEALVRRLLTTRMAAIDSEQSARKKRTSS